MTEDILEKAKKADIDLMAITDWGQLRDLFGELIAEIERLRSENKIISDRAAHHEKQDAAEIELLAARIKELEAVISEAFQELVTAGPDIGDIAAMSISLAVRKLASQNKRLEAAFLESEAAMLFYRGTRYPVWPDIGAHAEVYRQKAREALERIKAGGKDD